MTERELQKIVDRVMASLRGNVGLPPPVIVGNVRDIPEVQRKAGLHEFRYGAFVCLPMVDLLYLYRERLSRDFGDDAAALEAALRRALTELATESDDG